MKKMTRKQFFEAMKTPLRYFKRTLNIPLILDIIKVSIIVIAALMLVAMPTLMVLAMCNLWPQLSYIIIQSDLIADVIILVQFVWIVYWIFVFKAYFDLELNS